VFIANAALLALPAENVRILSVAAQLTQSERASGVYLEPFFASIIYGFGQQFIADLLAAKACIDLGVVDDEARFAGGDVSHFGEPFPGFALEDERAAAAFFDPLDIHNDSFPQTRVCAKRAGKELGLK